MSTLRRVHPADFPSYRRDVRSQRGLPLDDLLLLRRRRAEGWTIAALANTYGISRRTVYRYLSGEVQRVSICGWVAYFHANTDGPFPARISHWTRAA